MKQLQYIILFFSIIIATVFSCSPVQNVQQVYIKPAPASFDGNTDTISSASLNWKQFFTDKYLLALIDTTLANNWELQIALQRLKQAQSDVLFAKGAMLPSVNGGAAASINKFGVYTMDGAGNKGTEIYNGKEIPKVLPDYFVGLQTAWEADIWGKLNNQKKAAAARLLSTEEGKNLVITSLVSEVATYYYQLNGLDQTLKIIDTTIGLQENALEIVKVQKEAAAANELAVKQFEAQLLNLRSQRLAVLQQIAETENNINYLAGRYPQPIQRDTSFFANNIPSQVKLGIPAALLQNRPDIRQAEFDLAAAKADVQSARAAFYPSLNIGGTLGFQAFKTGLLFRTPESVAYSLLGSLSAPLINRSAIKAQFNRANAVQLEALYNYQKTVVNGYIEVYNEMLKIKNLQQVMEVKTNEVNVLTQSVETSEVLFRTGRATYLEVLIAQQNAVQAKLELAETKTNQFLSTVNIYKALGGGWR